MINTVNYEELQFTPPVGPPRKPQTDLERRDAIRQHVSTYSEDDLIQRQIKLDQEAGRDMQALSEDELTELLCIYDHLRTRRLGPPAEKTVKRRAMKNATIDDL